MSTSFGSREEEYSAIEDTSRSFNDDEESIADRAEAALRAQYSRNRSSESVSQMMPPPVAVKTRTRNSASKRSMDEGSARASKRRREERSEHSAFAPPPVAEKGAYRFAASDSHAKVSHALASLGVPKQHHTTVHNAIVTAKVNDDDDASFVRKYAVTAADMFGANRCCICEEQTSFAKNDAQKMMAAASNSTRGMTAQQRQKERLLRAVQARSNLSEADQSLHRILYEIEISCRGRINDDRIFTILIILRREFIEKQMERDHVCYVPWTLAMLKTHYDPSNDHFYQPLRCAQEELKLFRERLKDAYDSCKSGGTYDFRGFKAMAEIGKMCQSYRAEIDRQLDELAPNVSENLRMLAEAVGRHTRDNMNYRLLTDAEAASGKVEAGGDNRTSAALKLTHEPHSEYVLSHLSAQ